MCHGDVLDLDVVFTAEVLELGICELGSVIRYDPVRDAITIDDLGDELDCFGSSDLCDRLDLDPLGELVNCDEDVCVNPPLATLNGPTMSSPQVAKGQVIGMVCNSAAGT
jgi:hypothetical protein